MLLVAACIASAPADLLFVAMYRYHAYVPGDPMIDWLPFVHTEGWVISPREGGRFINGGSPDQLRYAWLVLAIPVWATAVATTAWVMQLSHGAANRQNAVEPRA